MPVKTIGADAEFPAALKAVGSKLLVVDFFAQWYAQALMPSTAPPNKVHFDRCGPCKRIAPAIEQLATKYPDVEFFKVDVDVCTVRGQTGSRGRSLSPPRPLTGQAVGW